MVKNLPANAGDARNLGLILGSGRFSRGGNGSPLQYSCLGNPIDRGAVGLQSMGSQSCTRLNNNYGHTSKHRRLSGPSKSKQFSQCPHLYRSQKINPKSRQGDECAGKAKNTTS